MGPQSHLLPYPSAFYRKSTNNFLGTYWASAVLLNREGQAPGLTELITAVRRDKQENGCLQMSAMVRDWWQGGSGEHSVLSSDCKKLSVLCFLVFVFVLGGRFGFGILLLLFLLLLLLLF